MRLAGKVIAITGAGSGIGRVCALTYATEGGLVAVTDLDGASARAVAREITAAGGGAAAGALDVTARMQISSVVDGVVARFGKVDVWHNNAGVSTMGRFVELTEQDWDVNMDVNAKGVFTCSQIVARYMIARGVRGKIINTASMAGRRGSAPLFSHHA